MSALLTGALVSALSVAVLAFMCWRAPQAVEDERGFVECDEHGNPENLGI